MTNGFYECDKMTVGRKKKFLLEAIHMAYSVQCQSKYKNGSSSRFNDKDLTVGGVIAELLAKKHRLDAIDRFAYNLGAIRKELCEYEIVLHADWTFLYVFVNEDSFNKLVKKYKLKLKEW